MGAIHFHVRSRESILTPCHRSLRRSPRRTRIGHRGVSVYCTCIWGTTRLSVLLGAQQTPTAECQPPGNHRVHGVAAHLDLRMADFSKCHTCKDHLYSSSMTCTYQLTNTQQTIRCTIKHDMCLNTQTHKHTQRHRHTYLLSHSVTQSLSHSFSHSFSHSLTH